MNSNFFQRTQMQTARPTMATNTPSLRPGSQTPTAAVYPTNQPIMMAMAPMPFPSPQAAQYYIPQYRHSTPYVGPPQQYSVQPPGTGTFYPGPGPGEYPAPYPGPSYYQGHTVYPPSPPIIVPTPQQPPPAKREKKTIRIRDPNQGGRDITEEIMAGGSGSRNSTPPVGRPSSTPTPPQVCLPDTLGRSGSSCGGEALRASSLPALVQPEAPVERLEAKAPVAELSSPVEPELPSPASMLAPVTLPSPAANHSERPSARESTASASPPSSAVEEHKPSLAPPQTPSTDQPLSDAPPSPAASPAPPPKALNGLADCGTELDALAPEPSLQSSAALQPQASAPAPLEAASSEALASDVRPESPVAAALAPNAPVAVVPVTLTSSAAAASPAALPLGLPPLVQATTQVDEPSKSSDTKDLVPIVGTEAGGGITDSRAESQQQALTRKSPTTGTTAESLPERRRTPRRPRRTWKVRRAPFLWRSYCCRSFICIYTFFFFFLQTPHGGPDLADPSGKRQYNRDFLLGFQFMPACVQKPEGLPPISDVVLDKINQNKLPPRVVDTRAISRGPDFTPAFADFGRQMTGGRGSWPCQRSRLLLNSSSRILMLHSQMMNMGTRRPPPRKIIMNVSVNEIQLKKSENAWKPGMKRPEVQADDPEVQNTQELFKKVRSILNKLTPQKFNQLMKQVTDLTIDTEERLKGVIDLVFEKAIDEPSFSVAYGNMCRCLATLKVPMTDKPNTTVNFRKLLLNRCQKEFEKDKVDDVTTERERLQEELEEAKDKARRRSIGNIRFIGELFKLKMLTEAIMHDCVVKLLKNHDEESLECLCRLLTTIGKDLDFEKAKPRMDQYFHQMEKIVKERKVSSRIRFMLQDIMDLRLHNWVSRRADQGPKTIEQIHKEAKIEEQEEQRKVQQQLLSKDSKRRPGQSRKETWNTVPVTKNSRTIDPTKIPKISKPQMDEKIQLGPRAQVTWGKGSSGGAKASDSGKNSLTDPTQRDGTLQELGPEMTRCGFPACAHSRQTLMSSLFFTPTVKPESVVQTPERPPLSVEETERKSKSIIDEFLHINDSKEAVQCVSELDLGSQLHVFVRVGVESTLERSQITRDHMGQLLFLLVQQGILPKPQFYKGFADTLELADDMAIDIPHIWLYLAELLAPVLKEEAFSMRELFSELGKPLLPVGRAGILISEILHILCKRTSHRTVASLWRESALSWDDFLPEDEDVEAFISEQKLQFLSDGPEGDVSKRILSPEELSQQLERLLLEDMVSDEEIFKWAEATVDESQTSSSPFLRALMTAVCKAAVKDDTTNCRVDTAIIQKRLPVLLKYLNSDTERQLQALYALQALIVALDQPPNLLRMFFDCLYDEDVISEDAFYKWETSKDPAEQQGKGVALKSVTAFFTWLREAEEESEDN
uniref:Eukaryotic translation initiation factor 4 gamma 3 n=1 Tax=Gasterosteus aculeatus aculeatus TaxID=481459 RepID=A0AAQ4QS81_GASAC